MATAEKEHDELISVIIPTYNRAGLLERSMKSVLSQTYANLELLIIDDYSNDNTEELVKGFSDKRIRYYRNEHNMGPSASRNKGTLLAKGNLIAYQDSDDEWKPDKLALLMEVWKREGNEEVGMIYHEMQEQATAGIIPSRDIPLEWKSEEIFSHMLLYPMIGATASLIRKACLEELGGFNEKLGSFEDYELYLRMAKKYRILFVEEPLLIIYDTPGSVNKRFKSKIDTELYILDTLYDSLCQYDILQKKVNLIRQQAENYDCEDYFYEQALKLCERLKEEAGRSRAKESNGCGGEGSEAARLMEKQMRIKECISNAAKEIGQNGGGDRAAYYQNAAGQIQRVEEGLSRLQENLLKDPAMVSQNRTAIVETLSDIIKDLGDYTDLALHPVQKKQSLDELLERMAEGRQSDEVIRNVLDQILEEARQLLLQIGKSKCFCTACGKEVRFLPPSPYKRVMREHYGYRREDIDFLFEGEQDRCPACGAPENIRFLLGFLEDVQPEENEKLRICCIETPEAKDGGVQEWIRKYAAAKEYMEYIPPKHIEGKTNEKLDVIICTDILEQAWDDSKIPEKLRELLGKGGVCIIMVQALLRDDLISCLEEVLDSSFGERAVINFKETGDENENFKKFGLEGIRRIYRECDVTAKFEKVGFSVEIVDLNWFGREYYEQCGFGEKAKMFMLAEA